MGLPFNSPWSPSLHHPPGKSVQHVTVAMTFPVSRHQPYYLEAGSLIMFGLSVNLFIFVKILDLLTYARHRPLGTWPGSNPTPAAVSTATQPTLTLEWRSTVRE